MPNRLLSLYPLMFLLFSVLPETCLAERVKLKLEMLTDGLEKPVGVLAQSLFPDRLLILEQAGKVRVFENGSIRTDKVFLDISKKVISGGEMGLLGMALHPKFFKNPKAYVVYTQKNGDGDLYSRYSEFSISSKTGMLDPASEKKLFSLKQPYQNHNGGGIAFGPDGYLYIGVGDGGSSFDPHNHGPNTRTLFSSILRLDVMEGDPYIPPIDNPFVRKKKKGRPEIYAWGLRNPWRFSFDSETGQLWVGDLGQGSFEEINIVRKGGNYGWGVFEAEKCLKMRLMCKESTSQKPLFSYPNSEGTSITGGYVYRGSKIPSLIGHYIYGDYVSGKIWALQVDKKSEKVLSNKLLLKTDLKISSFGEDSEGEILLVAHEKGAVYRLSK